MLEERWSGVLYLHVLLGWEEDVSKASVGKGARTRGGFGATNIVGADAASVSTELVPVTHFSM